METSQQEMGQSRPQTSRGGSARPGTGGSNGVWHILAGSVPLPRILDNHTSDSHLLLWTLTYLPCQSSSSTILRDSKLEILQEAVKISHSKQGKQQKHQRYDNEG